MSVRQHTGARIAFWAAAFCLAAIGLELGLVMVWSLTARVMVAGCFGFIAFGGLVYALHSISLIDRTQPSLLVDYFNDTLPRVGPPTGEIKALELLKDDDRFDAMSVTYIVKPGEQIDWGRFRPEWSLIQPVYRCDVTAQTSTPIFDVELSVQLDVREAVEYKDGEQTEVGSIVMAQTGSKPLRSGTSIASRTVTYKIRRVDPNAPFTFFIGNRTPFFAIMKLVKTASASKLGSEERQTIQVNVSRPTEMSFSPAPPRNAF